MDRLQHGPFYVSLRFEFQMIKTNTLPCHALTLDLRGDIITETTPLAWATGQNKAQAAQRTHLVKAVLYAVQTFYAFMLM